jgi:deoxyribodipyrimidine photo-lyase
MADQARRFGGTPILYWPYVEPADGRGRGLLDAWGARACVVVTDDFPHFFLPRAVAAAARRLPVRLEAVDGNGLLPVRGSPQAFSTAHAFRRHLQRHLAKHLDFPPADPLRGVAGLPRARVPRDIVRAWPAADLERVDLGAFPIDHAIAPVRDRRGGESAARRRADAFLDERLGDYATSHGHPDADATSGLSPYLHFGQISPHEVFRGVLAREGAERFDPAAPATGRRGWFGLGAGAEAFLDELITWREVGLNFCAHHGDECASYATLPAWARATLEAHRRDRREHVYTCDELAAARTGDPVWNAAQNQLVVDGRIHNYMRMLWGKKILGWTPDPRTALAIMLELNDRYALDGRDPSSVSGITWVLGRYDRPWGPERAVFGTVRYMTSASAARKLRLKRYVERYTPAGE